MDSSISHDPKAPDVTRPPRAPGEETEVPIEYSGPTNQPETAEPADDQEATSTAQTAAGADEAEVVADSASEADEAPGAAEAD